MLLTQSSRPTLGKALAAYHGAPISDRQVLTWYLPGMLIALLLFGYGLSRALQARAYGPAATAVWGRSAFIAAAALLAVVLFFMLRHVRSRRRVVVLHQNGLSFRNIPTPHKQLLWNQISGITVRNERIMLARLPVGTRYRVTLIPVTGRLLRLDERITHLPELSARIKARLYPRLKEEYQVSLKEGRWLYFGPVQISKSQLKVRQQSLTWDQVKRVRVTAGKLVFERRAGGEIALPTGQIPNLECILTLLEEEITK